MINDREEADRTRPLNQDPRSLSDKQTQAGLTGAELAEAAGISASYLSQIKKGRHSASGRVLGKLAAALGCEIADLMPDNRRHPRPRQQKSA